MGRLPAARPRPHPPGLGLRPGVHPGGDPAVTHRVPGVPDHDRGAPAADWPAIKPNISITYKCGAAAFGLLTETGSFPIVDGWPGSTAGPRAHADLDFPLARTQARGDGNGRCGTGVDVRVEGHRLPRHRAPGPDRRCRLAGRCAALVGDSAPSVRRHGLLQGHD